MQVNLPAWARYPDFERVQWLNDLISQLWPNIKAASAGIVREQIDPMMRKFKPAWIYDIAIHTFSLGENPIRVSAVKVRHVYALPLTCLATQHGDHALSTYTESHI